MVMNVAAVNATRRTSAGPSRPADRTTHGWVRAEIECARLERVELIEVSEQRGRRLMAMFG